MPSHRTHAACTDAPLHTHTHTQNIHQIQKIGETTTGEDKCAKCIPHVNKHHNAQQCTPQLPPTLSTALASAWGLGSIRQRKIGGGGGGAVSHAGRTFCPLLSSAALTLH